MVGLTEEQILKLISEEQILKLKELLKRGKLTETELKTALEEYKKLSSKDPTLDFVAYIETRLQEANTIIEPSDTLLDSSKAIMQEKPWSKPTNEKYSEKKQLGKGGMGTVLLVSNWFDRPEAMKFPNTNDEHVLNHFYREALYHARLSHPGIPPVYEITAKTIGKTKKIEVPCFTMKAIEGKDLEKIIEEYNYTTQEAVRWLVNICNAIDYAHTAKNIIHRDLKPSNVMVGSFGELYVMDWGLAKHPTDEDLPEEDNEKQDGKHVTISMKTETGIAKGTLGYMPPEQAEGISGKQQDIYTIGAIAYELLTKKQFREWPLIKTLEGKTRKPTSRELMKIIVENSGFVQAEDTILVEHKNKKGKTEYRGKLPPFTIPKRVPAPLRSIIRKAIEPDLKERYQTVAELRDDLQAYLDDAIVKAHKYGIGERIARYIRRNPTKTAVSILGTIALTLGAIGYNALETKARQAEREKEKQEMRAQEKELKAAQAEAKLSKTLQEQLERAQKRNRANEKIWLAERALKRRNLEDAIRYATEAIREDENCGEAYFLRGKAQYTKYRSEESVSDFLMANQASIRESKKPDYRALYSAAMTHIDLDDDMQKAIDICKKIQIDRNTKEPYLLLIRSLLAFGDKDYKNAIELAEEALHLDDTNAEAWSFLSHAYATGALFMFEGLNKYKDDKKALDYILNALIIEPENIRYQLHELRLQTTYAQNNERALELADKIIKTCPWVQFSYICKATVYLRQGRNEEVVNQINLAEKIKKLDYQALAIRGMAKCHLKQYPDALIDLNESIRQGKMPDAYIYRGRVYGETGRFNEGAQECNEGIRLIESMGMPSHLRLQYATAHLFKGIYEEKAGRPQEALKTLAKAVEYGDPRGLLYAGRVYIHQRQDDE
ncbi:MAG: protein kinase, partial [Candidatus Woesearchaeota archaeon]